MFLDPFGVLRTVVVGEAGDGEMAVAAAHRLQPDVVLMDIRMPVLDGIEATRRIVRGRPRTRVLMLTTFSLDGYAYDALLAPAVTRAVIEEFARQPAAVRSPPPAMAELTGPASARSSTSSRAGSRTPRSASGCTSARRPPRRTSRGSSASAVCGTVQPVIYAHESGLMAPGAS